MSLETTQSNSSSQLQLDEGVTGQPDAVLRTKNYQIILLQEQLRKAQTTASEATEKLLQTDKFNRLLQNQLAEIKAEIVSLRDQKNLLTNQNNQLEQQNSLLENQLTTMTQLFDQADKDLNALRQTKTVRLSSRLGNLLKPLTGKGK